MPEYASNMVFWLKCSSILARAFKEIADLSSGEDMSLSTFRISASLFRAS